MVENTSREPDKDFPLPGSCDCHVHVIGPKSRFPLAEIRSYTPRDAPVEALSAMMARLGLERTVIVQPSIYSTDNSCLLDALARRREAFRGVAVPADDASSSELDAMHELGVRGIRLNTVSSGASSQGQLMTQLLQASAQCARHGWHLQIFALPPTIAAIASTLSQLPVPVVFDHFAGIRPASIDSDVLGIICGLMEKGRAWIKLSGFYRIAEDPFDPSIETLARRFVDANPEQVVWASDWPHTPPHQGNPANAHEEAPYRDIDTRGLLHRLRDWFEPSLLRQILVDNPARLYDFG